jgi:hypothetical protein
MIVRGGQEHADHHAEKDGRDEADVCADEKEAEYERQAQCEFE